jgi:hypothetical protein
LDLIKIELVMPGIFRNKRINGNGRCIAQNIGTDNMTTKITTKADVKAMVAALEKMPRAETVWSGTGVYVKAPNGKEVLRAMVGRDGSYLVRHMEGLFS